MMDQSFDEPLDTNELEELKLILDNNESSIVLLEEPQNQSKKDKIKNLIDDYKLRSCWFDCTELFNFYHLFGPILIKLLMPELNLDELDEYRHDLLDDLCVNNYQNFINRIELKLKKIKFKNQIVVLNNAEYLAKSNKEYIEFLANANNLIKEIQFTIVLISSFKIDHFTKLGLAFDSVYCIEFSPYTIDQIKSSIIASKPERFPIGSFTR